MIDILIPIWERVLQRSPIDPEDNFFALGGNPASARKLFAEIAKVSGKFLPAELIYQAPTVATLSRLLEENPTPRLPATALLKSGAQNSPVFFIHGLGGSVMEFFDLVNYVDAARPIYGLQAKGNDGIEQPFERIEELADYYLDAIRTVQPGGPYFIVGYSLGGLAALEMAQQLSSKREIVSMLAMVESYPHLKQLPLGPLWRLVTRRARGRIAKILSPTSQLNQYLKGSSHVPEDQFTGWLLPQSEVGQRVYRSAYLAWTRYRPKHYEGKIRFVKAATPTIYPDDPVAVWGKLADKIEVQTVPGDHHEILMKNFVSLGAVLSRYLAEGSEALR